MWHTSLSMKQLTWNSWFWRLSIMQRCAIFLGNRQLLWKRQQISCCLGFPSWPHWSCWHNCSQALRNNCANNSNVALGPRQQLILEKLDIIQYTELWFCCEFLRWRRVCSAASMSVLPLQLPFTLVEHAWITRRWWEHHPVEGWGSPLTLLTELSWNDILWQQWSRSWTNNLTFKHSYSVIAYLHAMWSP